ncbi:hypothetical protein ANTRET_LOCUS3638 [Anthophora retusa]
MIMGEEKILEQLLVDAANELKLMNVDVVLAEFQPILDEFYALSESMRASQPAYNTVFTNFLSTLCEIYPTLRINILILRLSNYSVDVWGPVYWRFFHYCSILVAYAFQTNRINDMLDLSTLIYNVDCILPCSMCTMHYQAIKPNTLVQNTVKNMSFARVMSGVQEFHNIVTKNISQLSEHQNYPKKPYFNVIDFAKTYKCVEQLPEDFLKSNTYVRCEVDWQTPRHRLLTTFLLLSARIPYTKASNMLKRQVYPAIKEKRPLPKEVLKHLFAGITLQVDQKLIEENIDIVDESVTEFYRLAPDVWESLVNLVDPKSSMGKYSWEKLRSLRQHSA